MHLPQVQHMEVAIKSLRYMKGTSSRGIFFAKNNYLDLITYTDVGWEGDQDERKSISGYCYFIKGKSSHMKE